jgi:hypothetical protein
MACSLYFPACSDKIMHSGKMSSPAERLCYSSCIEIYTSTTSGGCYTSKEFAVEYCDKLVASGLALAPINDTKCSDISESCWRKAVSRDMSPNGGLDYSEADSMYNASVSRVNPDADMAPGSAGSEAASGLLFAPTDQQKGVGVGSDGLPGDGTAQTLWEALTVAAAAVKNFFGARSALGTGGAALPSCVVPTWPLAGPGRGRWCGALRSYRSYS